MDSARKMSQKLLWPLLKIKAPKRLIPARGDDKLQAALSKAADALAAEKTARKEHAEWEHVELERPPEEDATMYNGEGHSKENKVEEGEDSKEGEQREEGEADDD